MDTWESKLAARLAAGGGQDAAHDLGHVRRVRANALLLSDGTDARLEVVLPAVWLHDGVAVSKDSPERSRASRLAGAWARGVLEEMGYPGKWHDGIVHAIEAHSFSAGIVPTTLEAKIVQDADRLDALGAIGIARCFAVGGALGGGDRRGDSGGVSGRASGGASGGGRAFYAEDDPFCEKRLPDDGRYTVDHFYAKLFRVAQTMQTEGGRSEAERRTAVMRGFLDELAYEIGGRSADLRAGDPAGGSGG